jgi:serine protease Do
LRPQDRTTGVDAGLYVDRVEGAAREAEVQVGDVIVGANGHKVATVADLEAQIESSRRSIALLVNRQGANIFIPVRIGN